MKTKVRAEAWGLEKTRLIMFGAVTLAIEIVTGDPATMALIPSVEIEPTPVIGSSTLPLVSGSLLILTTFNW